LEREEEERKARAPGKINANQILAQATAGGAEPAKEQKHVSEFVGNSTQTERLFLT